MSMLDAVCVKNNVNCGGKCMKIYIADAWSNAQKLSVQVHGIQTTAVTGTYLLQ